MANMGIQAAVSNFCRRRSLNAVTDFFSNVLDKGAQLLKNTCPSVVEPAVNGAGGKLIGLLEGQLSKVGVDKAQATCIWNAAKPALIEEGKKLCPKIRRMLKARH